MRVLYVVRGLPGSGKSTMAEKLVGDDRYVETDMWCSGPEGQYLWKKKNTERNRRKCFTALKFFMGLDDGRDVAVSSTHLTRGSYQPYLDLARDRGFFPMVIDMHGEEDSTHDVPVSEMRQMALKWEPHQSGKYNRLKEGGLTCQCMNMNAENAVTKPTE